MSESPEQKWDRVQKKLQDTVLSAYPNPNRQGCPGSDAIRELAIRASKLDLLEGDAQWEHVSHCSPCYAEYLEARDVIRRAKGDSLNDPSAQK
jgi:hypothetical protein